MAAGEYLKSAASSLRRASEALKLQAKEMQANLTRIQHDKTTFIDKQHLEIKAKQVEQSGVNDQGRQSALSIQIQKLQNEIIAAQQEMKEAESNLQAAVSAKLNTSAAIENQAKQLESQAGSID